MSRNSVFLTGASGNVGRAVLQELVAQGYEVLALVRRTLPDGKGYRPVFGDLTNLQDIVAEIASTSAIIHCASPRTNDRSVVLREDINGTACLIDAWNSGPFVYMSSQTVYGIPSTILSENSPLNPCTWYDMGKICNEYQLSMESAGDLRGVGISLRLPILVTSGPRRYDRQFVPTILSAVRARRPLLFGSAEALEQCGSVYIGEKDLGRAVVDALKIQTASQYNLASGFCTWKELLEKMARLVGEKLNIVFRAGAIAEGNEFRMPQSRSFYDCSRFNTATGFQPRQSLDELVESLVLAEGSARS